MWGSSEYGRNESARERDLREQNERLEAENADRREREERAFEASRRERKDRLEEARRTVATWPEAFGKQRFLYGQELAENRRDLAQFPDEPGIQGMIDSWERSIAACDRAAEVWVAESATIEAEIERLRAGLRERVAAAVENDDPGLAGYLREDRDPSEWLNW